jgi:hypothetical protein
MRIVNTSIRTNTNTKIGLTAAVCKLARTVTLTACHGAGAYCPVTINGVRVTSVGSAHTVIVCGGKIIRVVVKRSRHVTAAELYIGVVMTGSARIKVAVSTTGYDTGRSMDIVGPGTLTGTRMRRAVSCMTLTAVKVRSGVANSGAGPRTINS